MTDPLADEWTPGPDGVWRRSAARMLILDAADRVLLLRGHDVNAPERSWWFTVGGGIGPGESAMAAAVREAAEETGLALDPAQVVGPVFRRSALFEFYARPCRQDELFFLATVDDPGRLSRDGWTAVEHDSVDEVRWWTLDELAVTSQPVYPPGLERLLRWVGRGWDGSLRVID